MKNFALYALLLALGLSLAPAAHATTLKKDGIFEDLFRPSTYQELGGRILTKIADLDVKANIDLFDLALSDGLGISSRYTYEVQRGYQPDMHVRTDLWRLRSEVKVGDLIQDTVDENFPLFLNIQKDAEVVYLRQFNDKKKALKAAPYLLKQLPVTAAKAIEHLKVGDMASIPVRMSIALGARLGIDMNYIKADVTKAYVIRGNFTVQVFRASDNMLRVRVFARTSKGPNDDARAKINLEMFGIEELENVVKRIVRLDLFHFFHTVDEGQVLLFDYLFDTNSEEARAAYDQILNSTLTLKDAQLLTQYITGGNPQDAYMSSMKSAEELSYADKDSATPRVRRLALVENKYKQDIQSERWGILIAGWRQELNYVENTINLTDKDGQLRNFFNPSFVRFERSDFGVVASGIKSEVRKTIYSILEGNSDGTNMALYNLGVVHDQNESEFDNLEQKRLRNTLITTLPEGFFDTVDWKDWGWATSTTVPTFKMRVNARVIFQVSLKATALPLLKRYTEAEMFTKIRSQAEASYRRASNRDKNAVSQAIANALYRVVNDGSMTDRDRVSAIMELRKSEVFTKIGVGFITGLLTKDEMAEHAYMKFEMFSKKTQPVAFEIGTPDKNDIDRVVRDIDLVLNERNVDPARFLPGAGALD